MMKHILTKVGRLNTIQIRGGYYDYIRYDGSAEQYCGGPFERSKEENYYFDGYKDGIATASNKIYSAKAEQFLINQNMMQIYKKDII
jgi:hypothetical protein